MTTEMHVTIVKGLRFRSISCLTMLESGRSIYLLMTGVWAVAILLAALPLFGFQYFYNFYGRSGVCLALHITNDRPSGWEYSVFVFLVLNFMLFGIIALNYFLLYKTVRNHKVRMRRTNSDSNWNEMKMLALRVFLVVATDALCWLPIIFLGILSISGVDIPPSVFSWTAVFILPINSVINPILYTFTSRTMTNAIYSLRNSICHRRQLYRNSSGCTSCFFLLLFG
ncbi:hypothetical protein Pcinc_013671 [Petrolisthes cinctipes]|uniref:G-protein coupled receptors family 1 profile domain-containing protein n=1 Tax=Petrolisthes cinctipes TaxID=88211 RepID=A0AAE1FWH5_PETCI|nr:hypothetical protein Pcinc_013671 [Petrolisthes cinctipes]